jgi:hypothetical protein
VDSADPQHTKHSLRQARIYLISLSSRIPARNSGCLPAANGAHKFCVVGDLNFFQYDGGYVRLKLLGCFGAELGVVDFWMRQAGNRRRPPLALFVMLGESLLPPRHAMPGPRSTVSAVQVPRR